MAFAKKTMRAGLNSVTGRLFPETRDLLDDDEELGLVLDGRAELVHRHLKPDYRVHLDGDGAWVPPLEVRPMSLRTMMTSNLTLGLVEKYLERRSLTRRSLRRSSGTTR